MRRLRTFLILLLTVALIALFAVMPKLAAAVSDQFTNGRSGSAPMQSVELALDAHKTDEPGYMMRKLALEQRMVTIPIEPEQASMTEEEVLNAAQVGMSVYIEANMFDWFEYTFCSAEPYLGIDPEDKNNNSIFWGVTFTTQSAPYHYLFLHIDDETGRILYLSYETDGPDKFNYYYPENQRLMMEGFVDAFFSPLNLTRRNEYENLLGESVIEQDLTDDVTCVVYTFEDAQYGTIHVAFHISPEGLHVYFPSK